MLYKGPGPNDKDCLTIHTHRSPSVSVALGPWIQPMGNTRGKVRVAAAVDSAVRRRGVASELSMCGLFLVIAP